MPTYKGTIKIQQTFITFIDNVDDPEEAEAGIESGLDYGRRLVGSEEWVSDLEEMDAEYHTYTMRIKVMPGYGYSIRFENPQGRVIEYYEAGDHPLESGVFGSGLTPVFKLKAWADQTAQEMARYYGVSEFDTIYTEVGRSKDD